MQSNKVAGGIEGIIYMKLYATTTSERASKGQGGNKYICIQLLAGKKRKVIADIELFYKRNQYGVDTYTLLLDNKEIKMYGETPEKVTPEILARLEHLRKELRAERISYSELAELQSLAEYIPKDDIELLEAAGVPEFEDEKGEKQKGEHYDPITGAKLKHCPNCGKK